jgi:CheY-like chemotaxis protein
MKAVASGRIASSAQEDVAYYFRVRQSDRSAGDRGPARAWWSLRKVPVSTLSAELARDGAPAMDTGNDRGVLVVDDHPESIEPVVRMLRKTGCDADCVESAAAALARLAAKRPKLVLLDIAMPEMDGIELLKELRRRPQTKDLPVVMLTADPLRAGEALELGALDYIVKPIDLPALKKRLAKYL